MSSKADFTPERGTYKDLTPFRYWCQKVLPLVYDDALSYYELLSKVLDYLNKTMEDVNTLHEDVDNLFEAYELLQTWVNDYTENYFEGEGFIQDLDAALDRMVASGEFGTIVNEKVASQINAVVASQIGGTVANQLPEVVEDQIGGTVAGQLPGVVNNQLPPVAEAWLNANINPGSNVLDSSLSIPPNDDVQAKAPSASTISSVIDGFLGETDLIELPRNYSSTHKHFSCYLDNLTNSVDPNITYKTEYAQFKKNNQLILRHKANYIDVNGVVCMPTYIQLTGNLIPPPFSISGGTMTWDSFAKSPNDYNAEAINSHYINAKSFSNVELTITIDLENIENANIDLTTMKLVMLKPSYAGGEYTGVISTVLGDIVFDDTQLSTHMVGHCSTTLPDLNYNGVGDYYGNNAGFAIYTGTIRTFEVDGNTIGGSSGIFGKNILATMSISFKSISNEAKEIANLKADLSELDDKFICNLLDKTSETYVENAYIDGDGNIVSANGYFISNHIPAKAGDHFVATYASATGLTNVRAFRADGVRVANVTGTLSDDGKYVNYTIPTLSNVKYVTFNGRMSVEKYMIIKGSDYPTTYIANTALQSDVLIDIALENSPVYRVTNAKVENTASVLQIIKAGEQTISVTVGVANAFVNASTDNINSSNNYNISNTIALLKGQTLSFTAKGYLTAVGMICLYDENADTYTTVVMSTDSDTHDYRYTPDKNCNVRCSYSNSVAPVAKIITPDTMSVVLEEIKGDIASNQKQVIEYPQMYNNIVFVGDSLTYGHDGQTRLDKNYPFYFGKLADCAISNQGLSGRTAKQWWDELGATFDFTSYDCAIIYLGTNQGLTDTVNTDCNASDYTQNADTNTGCYGKIIGKIQATNPGCKIFLIAGPEEYHSRKTAMNPAVRSLAAFYDCGLIDLENSILSDDGTTTSRERKLYRPVDGIHYDVLGYLTFANLVYDGMNDVMSDNLSEYKY